MNERPIPVVGFSYKAKARSWDLRQAASKEMFVSVRFVVKLGTDEEDKPIYWEREKILSFAPGAMDISLESLAHLGFRGNPSELWGGRGALPNVVEVMIGSGDAWKDKQGKVHPGEPQITRISAVGAIRMGKEITLQQASEWGENFAKLLKAHQRNGNERVGPVPSSRQTELPEGFEPPPDDYGPPTEHATAADDDDIPF